MGHKVNPVSLRLQMNKNWQSKWFADKDFSENLASDIEIRKVLTQKFGKSAGVALLEITRDQDSTKLSVHTSKPGILIGRSGQGIIDLKAFLVKNCPRLRNPKTGLAAKKIEIEIVEVRAPDLSAEIVAQNVAYQIEKRLPYKRAIKQMIGKVMDARAKGVKIAVAGRLGGAEIARKEHYGAGSVPLGRFRANIDFAHVDALTTYGIIGIKVWIYKGDVIAEEETE